ncbi:hypothetical protein JTB14_017144 [Gonioctena quinquepunctata]|nr:hypothetical protein JTB14_017144 [Gonioctena quinquepunctata]
MKVILELSGNWFKKSNNTSESVNNLYDNQSCAILDREEVYSGPLVSGDIYGRNAPNFYAMKTLPPLFEADDYKSCILNGNLYCKMMADLKSTANDSEVWRYIESTLEDNQKFQRNVLSRSFCIPKPNANNEASIKDYSENLINGRIDSLNLTSSIGTIACTDGNITRTSFDYFMLMAVISYGCLVAYATIQHYGHRNSTKGDGLLRKFSIWYNWKKKTRSIWNGNHEKLKSIQGMRFYVTIAILLVHTKLSYSFGFIKNTAEIEKVMSHPFFVALSIPGVFWVQIFFLISSWLLTLQICLIFQRHGEFSFKHASLLIINRYFRIAVTLSVLVALYNTTWPKFYQGPESFDFISTHGRACQENWHATLFFFNNLYFVKDMCNPISWYLSADFQMYVATTLILYVIYKLHLKMTIVIPVLLVISCTLYGTMIYINDMEIIFRPNIRNLEHGQILNSLSFLVNYSSTYSISSCSFIGIAFGAIYFRIRNEEILSNIIWKFLWICLFFGLPSLVVFISAYEFRGLEAAILGPLLKPLFVVGFGVGILGMSQNLGGIVKRIFEWEPVVLLSNFTYCIYICHLPILIQTSGSPLEIGFSDLVKDCMSNVVFSIFIGMLFTVSVEEPGITFQKMLIPQVLKYEEKKNEKQKKN